MIDKLPNGSLPNNVVYEFINRVKEGKASSIKWSIQEVKKLTVVLEKKYMVRCYLFNADVNDLWIERNFRLTNDLNNAKKMFSRPLEFDFNLDAYVKELKENDLADENQRMIFLNLCCSEDKNGKKFDFDKFVKYIPENSLGHAEINYVGDLLWLTNKRKIDLDMMEKLVVISSNIYALDKLLNILYYKNGENEDKWDVSSNAKQFLNNAIKRRISKDIEKILLNGSYDEIQYIPSDRECDMDKNAYILLGLFVKAGIKTIDLEMIKKICNTNIKLVDMRKLLTVQSFHYRKYKTIKLSKEVAKYLDQRINDEHNIDYQLDRIKTDKRVLEQKDVDEFIKKFTEIGRTRIFSKTMKRLCDISFDLDYLKQTIDNNNIDLSEDAKKMLQNKMAVRGEAKQKLNSILLGEPGSLKEARDIDDLIDLLFKIDGRKVSLDRMEQLCKIIGNGKLDYLQCKLARPFYSQQQMTDEAKGYLENAVKEAKLRRPEQFLQDQKVWEKELDFGENIYSLAKYYRKAEHTEINLDEIKKLRQLTNEPSNLWLLRYVFSNNGMKLEASAKKYIDTEIKIQAESGFSPSRNSDSSPIGCLYYMGVTEIDIAKMKQLCKIYDADNELKLDNLCWLIVNGINIVCGYSQIGFPKLTNFKFDVTKDAAEYLYKYIDNKKQEEKLKKKSEGESKNEKNSQKETNEIKKAEETEKEEKAGEVKDKKKQVREPAYTPDQKQNKEKKDENEIKGNEVNPDLQNNEIYSQDNKDIRNETANAKQEKTNIKIIKNKDRGGTETVKLESQEDLIVISVNSDRQNKDKTKTKCPKILLNIGKGGVGSGIGGFIISLILHFLLNTGLGWGLGPLLIALFGALLWSVGERLDETVSQNQDIGAKKAMPQGQNQSLIEQVEKRKEQQNTENKDSNQNEKNSPGYGQ